MSCASHLRLLVRRTALAAALLAPATLTCLSMPAYGQQATQRAVQGKVVDKADAGLKGAVVYLKDDHSLAVRSYIAADDGSYRFGQLAQNTDYEIWAESNGKKSSTKNLSAFDSRPVFNITLKIDTSK